LANGFLNDPKRLNVALSRMKLGLIILGVENAFCGDVGM
jgi:superfamily I DNA and/or RNA helicase